MACMREHAPLIIRKWIGATRMQNYLRIPFTILPFITIIMYLIGNLSNVCNCNWIGLLVQLVILTDGPGQLLYDLLLCPSVINISYICFQKYIHVYLYSSIL